MPFICFPKGAESSIRLKKEYKKTPPKRCFFYLLCVCDNLENLELEDTGVFIEAAAYVKVYANFSCVFKENVIVFCDVELSAVGIDDVVIKNTACRLGDIYDVASSEDRISIVLCAIIVELNGGNNFVCVLACCNSRRVELGLVKGDFGVIVLITVKGSCIYGCKLNVDRSNCIVLCKRKNSGVSVLECYGNRFEVCKVESGKINLIEGFILVICKIYTVKERLFSRFAAYSNLVVCTSVDDLACSEVVDKVGSCRRCYIINVYGEVIVCKVYKIECV